MLVRFCRTRAPPPTGPALKERLTDNFPDRQKTYGAAWPPLSLYVGNVPQDFEDASASGAWKGTGNSSARVRGPQASSVKREALWGRSVVYLAPWTRVVVGVVAKVLKRK